MGLVLITALALTAACVQDNRAQPVEAPTDQDEALSRVAMIAQAKQHLADTMGIEPDEVFLAARENRMWPDASLGYPQAGQNYAQVQTPGYLLLIEAQGEFSAYHTDLEGRIVAPDGTRIAAGSGAGGPNPPAVDAAISDLAERLGVAGEAVQVLNVEEVQWPNGALGLAEPGMMYTQAIVPGHRIVLGAEGHAFAYHSGGPTAVRYAGIAWPDDAEVSLLRLQRTEPADGNNFFHLHRVDPGSGEEEVAAEFVSSFVATPDGRTILLKVRRARSVHELQIMDAAGNRTTVAGAFDFTDMAIRPDGKAVAFWQRNRVGETSLSLHIRQAPWQEPGGRTGGGGVETSLPGVDVGHLARTELVWTDDGLAASVVTDAGPSAFYWTPDDGMQPLGEYEVLGWIPRTRSLLVSGARGDGSEKLSALIPGQGETMQLATAPDVLDAGAPFEGRYIVVALSDEEGQIVLQRIGWDGSPMQVNEYRNVESADLSVAPVGDMVAVSLLGEGVTGTRVIQMRPELTDLLTIDEPGPVQLVAD